MAFGTISITQPDGTRRTIPLTQAGLRIGSAPDNDLLVSGPGVAPHHAVITCAGDACRIVDAGSSGGTLLDGTRLLVNLPQDLEAGSVIRIGGWTLDYQTDRKPVPATASVATVAPTTDDLLLGLLGQRAARPTPSLGPQDAPAGAPPNGAPRTAAPPQSRAIPAGPASLLVLSLSVDAVQVAPGTEATITITIANRGTLVDSAELLIEGIPAGGYSLAPSAQVNLFPDPQRVEVVTLRLHPPRRSYALAGRYPFKVIARSVQGAPAVAEGMLEVLPFYQYGVTLTPQVRSAVFGAAYQLTIANDSNAEVPLTLSGVDPEAILRFEFPSSDVVAPPGTDLIVPLRVSATTTNLVGQPKDYSFAITAAMSLDADLFHTVNGRLTHRPLIPSALLKLLLALLLGLIGYGGIRFGSPRICQLIRPDVSISSASGLRRYFPFCAFGAAPAGAVTAEPTAPPTDGAAAAATSQIAQATEVQATQAAIEFAAGQTQQALGFEQTQTAEAASLAATQTALAAAAEQTNAALEAQFNATGTAQQGALLIAVQTQTAEINNLSGTQTAITLAEAQTSTAAAEQLRNAEQTQTAIALAGMQTASAQPTNTPPPTNTPQPTRTPTITPSSTPIPAQRLRFQASPANTQAGSAFTGQVIVRAEDTAGNLAATFNGPVTLAIKTGTGTGGAQLSGTVRVNAANGVATFNQLSIDKAGVGYILVATSGQLTGESGAFNITATRLRFVTSPSTTAADASFGTQPVVRAEDNFGNLDRTFNGPVTLAIKGGTGSATAQLGGTPTANAVNGVASFSSSALNIDRVGQNYQLQASSGSLIGDSIAFNITANRLLFARSPAFSFVGVVFPTDQQPVVHAVDRYGTLDPTFNGAVSLDLAVNPGSGSLTGPPTAAAVNGVATFGGLAVSAAGTGYQLRATSGSLTPVLSDPFTIDICTWCFPILIVTPTPAP